MIDDGYVQVSTAVVLPAGGSGLSTRCLCSPTKAGEAEGEATDKAGWERYDTDWRNYFQCMLAPVARQAAGQPLNVYSPPPSSTYGTVIPCTGAFLLLSSYTLSAWHHASCFKARSCTRVSQWLLREEGQSCPVATSLFRQALPCFSGGTAEEDGSTAGMAWEAELSTHSTPHLSTCAQQHEAPAKRRDTS